MLSSKVIGNTIPLAINIVKHIYFYLRLKICLLICKALQIYAFHIISTNIKL